MTWLKWTGQRQEIAGNHRSEEVKGDAAKENFQSRFGRNHLAVNSTRHVHHIGRAEFRIHIDNHGQAPAKQEGVAKFSAAIDQMIELIHDNN
ncbi:Uncharacterised protein [Chlamydia trachomatis]|nr:Uncharacterised protein [Chlamydia trachomatis]